MDLDPDARGARAASGDYPIELALWPGGERRIVARTDSPAELVASSRPLARAACVIGAMTDATGGTPTHDDLADRATELDEDTRLELSGSVLLTSTRKELPSGTTLFRRMT